MASDISIASERYSVVLNPKIYFMGKKQNFVA
jgi:hypothetical protein